MKKIIKTFFSIAVVFSLCLSIFSFNALAAGASIAFSKQNATVGDTITVTVTVSASDMYGVNVIGNYNDQVLTYASGASSGGAGVFRIADSESFNGESSKSFKVVFKAKASGSSAISVSGQVASGIPPQDVPVAASATLTVSDAAKSSNANLKALSLSAGSLSPKFSASRTSYTATVKNSVTSCKVYATAADAGSKVAVSGSSELKEGANTRTVTVTAPSGAQKVYTITITRLKEGEGEEEETPEVNPYETVIGDVKYTVATDISAVKLPKGFTATKATFNETEVSVAEDVAANYTIYYLKAADSDTLVPYILGNDGKTFEKLKYITFGENTYILADFPEGYTAPEGYYETVLKLGEYEVKAFVKGDAEDTDFYYIYCFFDGGYNNYCYDKKENVLQRSPYFKLVEAEIENDLPKGAGFLQKFGSLSNNSKIVVIGLLVAALGIIAIVVLLIYKLFKKDDDMLYENEINNESFDNITVTDAAAPETKRDSIK